MGVFYGLLVFLIILSLSKNAKLNMGGFSIFMLAFINAFRGVDVGSDTINYYNNNFDATFSLDFTSSYELEWLFQFITRSIYVTGIDSRWCVWILSIFTFLFLYLASKRYQKIMDLSLVLVAMMYFIVLDFYPLSFNIARQIASISILLYAYSFLYDNNKMPFFLWVFVASGIHLSSLLFIFIYFIRNINFAKYNFRIIFIVSYGLFFAVLMYKEVLLNFVVSYFPAMSIYDHLVEDTETTNKSMAFHFYEFVKLNINLYVAFKLLSNRDNKYVNIFIISIFAGLFFNAFYGNIARIVLGLSIINVIILASYFSKRKLSQIDKLVYVITLFIYSWTVLRSLSGGAYDVIPYYMTLFS